MRILSAIEAGVGYLLRIVYVHRLKVLPLVLLAIFGYVATNLPGIDKDGRVEAFMHDDDPALAAYYEMRREFGQDNRLIIAVSAPDIFDTKFLHKFSRMHREIADGVPYISEIFSLYNIPFIEYQNGGVYLEELVRNMLARDSDPASLRDRIVETPLYRNFIISKDGTTAAIIVEPYRYAPSANDCVPDPANGVTCQIAFTPPDQRTLLGAPQYVEMTETVREIASRYSGEGFEVHIAGAPVVSTEIVKMMDGDMPRFTLACVIITVLTMLVLHRSILIGLGAILSFVTAIFSTLATVAATGVAMTPPTQLLIPMTLVVGLCTYIHFTAALLKARAELSDGVAAIQRAVQRSNTPILFTALTTAGGLIGFLASPLAPIAALGMFGVVSVTLSYLLALFWATIVFRTLPERYLNRQRAGPCFIARVMARIAARCAAAPVKTLGLSAIAILVVSAGILRLDYSHNSLLWLPGDNPARQSTEFIDARYNGTVNLELVITPEKGRDFRDKTLLKTIEATARDAYADAGIPIGRHTSIISFIEETNHAIHAGDPTALSLPGQEEIWDQILLLEGQGIDDMKRYVSMDYGTGRVSFQTPWLEAKLYADVIARIEDSFRANLGAMAEVQATGLIALLAQTSKAVLDSMTVSYAIALLVVTVLMGVALRSAPLGLVSMLPNTVPFAMLLGIMGYLSRPLDTFSVLIGGIITGLIVDDTLHFFYSVRRRLEENDNVVEAVRESAHEVGRALFVTTIVMTLSFAVFMMSTMSNIRAFGMLMVLGAALGFAAEMIVGPAAIALYYRLRKSAPRDEAVLNELKVRDAQA